MNKNVGNIDRGLRFALGLGLIGLAAFSSLSAFDAAPVKYLTMCVGLVMLAVAATRVCPIYSVAGIKTCRG